MPDKVCVRCGKDFRVKPCHHKARFCSLTCANNYQRENPYPGPVKEKIEKHCRNCGKDFFVLPSRIDRIFFCSHGCQFEWRKKRMAGEGNPNWLGGLSKIPYHWTFKQISREVIRRDGECKNPLCDRADSRLVTHHINYDKADNRPENLVALCVTCNSKVNFNRDEWMKLFTN